MKAKDTVIKFQCSHKVKIGSKEWHNIEGYNLGAQTQAEISFKAGIREVVKWGLETCPHDLFGEGTQCYKRACDKCWQEKWGNLAP